MRYDEFVGQVQHRARLASKQQAIGAIRSTLGALATRLSSGEVKDLAAQLPIEIAYYLGSAHVGPERISARELIERIAAAERVPVSKATFHTRVVLEVLGQAVSRGEIEDVLAELPAAFEPLFDGADGALRHAR